jgi:hypothetical protein
MIGLKQLKKYKNNLRLKMGLIAIVLVHLFLYVNTRCSDSNEVITFNSFCPSSTTYIIGAPKT